MFASNTGISTSHNYFIALNRGETRTFRVLLRPLAAGRLNWRFFFSNSVDSTWADGTESYADLAGGRFEIVSAAVGAADENAALTGVMVEVDWPENIVEPKACVTSAPVEIDVPENGYIVYSWCLRALEDGCRLPATPDSQALCYIADGEHCFDGQDAFTAEQMVALPDQFAADRNVRAQMVFMGDNDKSSASKELISLLSTSQERQQAMVTLSSLLQVHLLHLITLIQMTLLVLMA